MLRTMGQPIERKQAPRSAYEAKFSGPYTVAAALSGGGGLGVGIDDFSDALVHDPARRALMQRITVVSDAGCDAVFPDQAPAILTVFTTAGEQRVERVMANRGSSERPLQDAEIVAKFSDNVRRGLPQQVGDELRDAIQVLPDGDVSAIATLLRRASHSQG
jgi:2-methylcitrate dehydratase PrpD